MFEYDELSRIMSALVTESINLKRMITNKQYCCKEELKSLENEVVNVEKLVNKVSNMLNN
jgi:hypothetical protein